MCSGRQLKEIALCFNESFFDANITWSVTAPSLSLCGPSGTLCRPVSRTASKTHCNLLTVLLRVFLILYPCDFVKSFRFLKVFTDDANNLLVTVNK